MQQNDQGTRLDSLVKLGHFGFDLCVRFSSMAGNLGMELLVSPASKWDPYPWYTNYAITKFDTNLEKTWIFHRCDNLLPLAGPLCSI